MERDRIAVRSTGTADTGMSMADRQTREERNRSTVVFLTLIEKKVLADANRFPPDRRQDTKKAGPQGFKNIAVISSRGRSTPATRMVQGPGSTETGVSDGKRPGTSLSGK